MHARNKSKTINHYDFNTDCNRKSASDCKKQGLIKNDNNRVVCAYNNMRPDFKALNDRNEVISAKKSINATKKKVISSTMHYFNEPTFQNREF